MSSPTAAQRAAIEAPLGPTLVVAGPGAGKTYCLIGRVGHLVSGGFRPARICAVTFTNKAAEEIAARLHDSLGAKADDVHRGTLHGLCVRMLREHPKPIGLRRGFGVADEAYQRLVLRRLGVPRRRWSQLLPLFGRRRLQGYRLTEGDERIYTRYLESLRDRNMVDFDGIIALTAQLLAEQDAIAERWAASWDYLLVDEFQDLNRAQYAILQVLAAPHRNFFAVGDDDQSIFSWTGADPQLLQAFARDYGIERPIVLDRNRRCSRQIFEVARRLLGENPSLFRKDLFADRESPHEVTAYGFAAERQEREWLIADLVADRARADAGWGDYGVLYRRHRVGAELEAAMVRAGVPCRLARGRALQDDPVIGYVVDSLRVLLRPDDELAVAAFAQRVLPEYLVERVLADAAPGGGVLDALRRFARGGARGDPETKKAWRFVYHVENLAALRQAHGDLPAVVEELLAQRIGRYGNVLEEHHRELSDPADDPRVRELARGLAEAAARGGRVLLERRGGAEIAARGMLMGAGVPGVGYLDRGIEPGEADLVSADDTMTLFKALQLGRSGDFRDSFRDFVTFDLETTHADPERCEILEVGAVRVRGGRIVDRFRSLVRPEGPVTAGASGVHGYTDADLRGAPSFADVWPPFRAFVGGDVLVAHNGQRFDIPVLRRAADGLAGLEELVFFDSLPLARALFDESARLEDLAKRFGVEIGRAHHALDDAEALAKVFAALEGAKVVRARKAALVNLLDYLGLGLALEGAPSTEAELLLGLARPFALGRYSDCLEFYAAARTEAGTPPVEEVIDRLGGREAMERIRAERGAAQRYPAAVARLRGLMEASRAGGLEESVERFLELVALSTSQGAEVDPHRVNLLTLHSTKGLEFSRVYVVGIEDYEIASYYAMKDERPEEIAEARRLLYVGMTRAEDRLVLTCCDERGGRDAGGSRFLGEMGLVARRVEPAEVP